MAKSWSLKLIYNSAIAALLGVLLVLVFLDKRDARPASKDSSIVEIAERQRALVQQATVLADELQLQSQQMDQEQLAAASRDLSNAITALEGFDEVLRQTANSSDVPLAALDGSSLAERIRHYVDLARTGEGVSLIGVVGLAAILPAVLVIAVQVFTGVPRGKTMPGQNRLNPSERHQLVSACTELEAANEHLVRQSNTLLAERAKLEQVLTDAQTQLAEQAAFTYAVSHDLKSPLNTLHLVLDELALAFGDKIHPETSEVIAQGRSTLKHMIAQIDDVLSFALATEKRDLPEEIDVKELVDEVRMTLAGDIASKDAKVSTGPSVPVWGMRSQIFCLVQNLVANAVKYSVHGVRPEIKVSCVPLPEGRGVRLLVADNGIGIAPEHHEKVFGLFQRLHLPSEYPGTGLGLSTCARIAWNHAGDISVVSDVGKGAVFKVTLRAPRTDSEGYREAA